MNEQIKECWNKAAREDCGETWDSQEQFIERFAELIVKECIVVAADAKSLEAAVRIKLHFGVEE